MRQCGECTLCCKLVPVKEIAKPAGVRCQHVRWGKGCKIYSDRPISCREWMCAWRMGADTADLHRPDRSHCVIDELGDMVHHVDNETGERTKIPAVQIWCDPFHPHAYLAPSILAFMRRRGEQRLAVIVRYSREAGIIIIPPALTGKGWVRYANGDVKLAHLDDCQNYIANPHNEQLQSEIFEFGHDAKKTGHAHGL